MDDDELSDTDTSIEIGSDELLSDDNLRLPENASPLVRLHAIRSWLTRRQKDTTIEIGMAALRLQEMHQLDTVSTRLRRRELQEYEERLQKVQKGFTDAQESLRTYEEASALLEDAVNHTTVGERLLVEYYLVLDELVQNEMQEVVDAPNPRALALMDVQRRIERIGISGED